MPGPPPRNAGGPEAVKEFLQAPGDYFDAEPTFKQSYAPQSGEDFTNSLQPSE